MQFTPIFVALLAAITPALGATVTGFAGANCAGGSVSSLNIGRGCAFFTNGGSARSWSYSGVTARIDFFLSGGAHDICTNGSFTSRGPGSGCVTAPDGFNIESAFVA